MPRSFIKSTEEFYLISKLRKHQQQPLHSHLSRKTFLAKSSFQVFEPKLSGTKSFATFLLFLLRNFAQQAKTTPKVKKEEKLSKILGLSGTQGFVVQWLNLNWGQEFDSSLERFQWSCQENQDCWMIEQDSMRGPSMLDTQAPIGTMKLSNGPREIKIR